MRRTPLIVVMLMAGTVFAQNPPAVVPVTDKEALEWRDTTKAAKLAEIKELEAKVVQLRKDLAQLQRTPLAQIKTQIDQQRQAEAAAAEATARRRAMEANGQRLVEDRQQRFKSMYQSVVAGKTTLDELRKIASEWEEWTGVKVDISESQSEGQVNHNAFFRSHWGDEVDMYVTVRNGIVNYKAE